MRGPLWGFTSSPRSVERGGPRGLPPTGFWPPTADARGVGSPLGVPSYPGAVGSVRFSATRPAVRRAQGNHGTAAAAGIRCGPLPGPERLRLVTQGSVSCPGMSHQPHHGPRAKPPIGRPGQRRSDLSPPDKVRLGFSFVSRPLLYLVTLSATSERQTLRREWNVLPAFRTAPSPFSILRDRVDEAHVASWFT